MKYPTADIRRFLIEAFSSDELSTLCADYFRDVYEEFESGMVKSQKIRLLLDYCQYHDVIPNLLAAIQKARPEQYEKQFPTAPRVELLPEASKSQRDPRQVFISHAHEDAEFAHRLAGDLQKRGWRVWIAPESIRPGEKWVEAINRGLEESGAFALVLTPAAIKSRWVKDETNVAIELEHEGRVRFVPLDVENCDVPPLWRAYQRVSFCGDYVSGLRSLVFALDPAQRDRQLREEAARREVERQAKLAAEKAKAERLERERQEPAAKEEAKRKALRKGERQAQLAAEKAEAERLERERKAREAKEKAANEEADRPARLAIEKAEAERKAREETAQREAEQQAKLAAEKAEAERLERERQERNARLERILKKLRDPLWQGIGAIVALAALVVVIGAWLWPDIHSALFPPPTPTVTVTPTRAPAPTAIAALTLTPSPTPLPGATPVAEQDGMVMVYVPAGKFLMGSSDSDTQADSDEKPQHGVNVDAFWIDRTEVTNAQYDKCVQAKPACKASLYAGDSRFNGDDQPVVGVDWNDAKSYCEWAGRRLPTEAEWEKAARGTDGRIYPWGNQVATCEYAVMDEGKGHGCAKGDAAWPVGSKPKGAGPPGVLDMAGNMWDGALDMAGNVWEWVADWYGEKYYASSSATDPNPKGPETGQYCVLRGGSWYNGSQNVRSAYRSKFAPSTRNDFVGFRCAR